MSTRTRDKISAALNGLPEPHQAQILSAVADLMAEAEIHIRQKMFEDVRKEWADTLSMMLGFLKR
jgi:hypothetical protein